MLAEPSDSTIRKAIISKRSKTSIRAERAPSRRRACWMRASSSAGMGLSEISDMG
jgi:hypothetical protein